MQDRHKITIRANICALLEESEYTSVKQRIDEISSTKPKVSRTPPIKLTQFIGASQTEDGISFSLKDYLELTDWTGRSVRADKSGYIKADTPKILAQLGIDEATWVAMPFKSGVISSLIRVKLLFNFL